MIGANPKYGILEQSTNHQLEFGELAATMKSDTEKPGLSSCHDEGISVISGAVPNFQWSDKVTTGIHANVKGGIIVNLGTDTDIQQIDDGVAHDTDGTLSPLMDEIKGDSNLNKEAGIAPIISTSNRVSDLLGLSYQNPK